MDWLATIAASRGLRCRQRHDIIAPELLCAPRGRGCRTRFLHRSMQINSAIAFMGFALQGWGGIFALIGICTFVVIAGIALFIFRVYRRTKSRLDGIQARLGPLSEEQLLEIMRTPTHPDSQFALVELRRRGVDARPTKDQLFGMLTSGNPSLCAHAMANLQVFYPEFVIPNGASNQDPPQMWKARIEAFRLIG